MYINEKYGEWTVIGEGTKKGYVLARCSCGTEREVLLNNLQSKRSRSCGCIKRPIKEFSTKNLTVLYKTRAGYHMCLCNKCKKEVEVSDTRIRKRPNSCGCGLRREALTEGEVVNGYKVIKILPTISGKKRVLAICTHCGKLRTLRLSSLKNKCICQRKEN